MTPDEITPERRAARRPRARRRARRRVRHRRRLHRLPRRPRAGRRPDRDRPRRARPADRRRDADPHHRLRRPEDRVLFGDGAGAVVLGPTDDGAGIGPIVLAADGGLGDTIIATHDDRVHPHGRPLDVQDRRQAPVASRPSPPSPRAGLELDDIDLFVYHQANARIIKAVGERLDLEPAKVADYIAPASATRRPPRSRSRSSLLREDGRLRPGQKVLRRRDRRRLHLGRRRDGVGRFVSGRPENATALVTGASKGIGAAIAQGARRRRLERRGQLPLRRGRRQRDREGDRGGRRQGRRASTPTSPTATPKALLQAGRGGARRPVLALVNNAGVRARRPRASSSTTRTGTRSSTPTCPPPSGSRATRCAR